MTQVDPKVQERIAQLRQQGGGQAPPPAAPPPAQQPQGEPGPKPQQPQQKPPQGPPGAGPQGPKPQAQPQNNVEKGDNKKMNMARGQAGGMSEIDSIYRRGCFVIGITGYILSIYLTNQVAGATIPVDTTPKTQWWETILQFVMQLAATVFFTLIFNLMQHVMRRASNNGPGLLTVGIVGYFFEFATIMLGMLKMNHINIPVLPGMAGTVPFTFYNGLWCGIVALAIAFLTEPAIEYWKTGEFHLIGRRWS